MLWHLIIILGFNVHGGFHFYTRTFIYTYLRTFPGRHFRLTGTPDRSRCAVCRMWSPNRLSVLPHSRLAPDKWHRQLCKDVCAHSAYSGRRKDIRLEIDRNSDECTKPFSPTPSAFLTQKVSNRFSSQPESSETSYIILRVCIVLWRMYMTKNHTHTIWCGTMASEMSSRATSSLTHIAFRCA